MYNPRFEKEAFKKDVTNNIKTLFRKELHEANLQELYQAVSYAVKEAIIDDWIETQKKIDKEDPKIVYYMSMEFLMGRALGNNLINMTAYKEVKEALDELGIRLYPGVTGAADESVDKLLAGSLDYNPDTSCSHHHEDGHDCGSNHCNEDKQGCAGNHS